MTDWLTTLSIPLFANIHIILHTHDLGLRCTVFAWSYNGAFDDAIYGRLREREKERERVCVFLLCHGDLNRGWREVIIRIRWDRICHSLLGRRLTQQRTNYKVRYVGYFLKADNTNLNRDRWIGWIDHHAIDLCLFFGCYLYCCYKLLTNLLYVDR